MTGAPAPAPNDGSQRLDKWLWHARFFKTRSLAAKVCNGGQVRSGGQAIGKAHHTVRVGDVLTFAQGRHIRVIKVLAFAARRGPAAEARALYEDLKPPEASTALPADTVARRQAGAGRPTKLERRRIERLRGDG